MAYRIVATRENEKVSCERASVLIAIAKARVWTSEGWQVVVTDDEGKTLEPAEFDKLLAASGSDSNIRIPSTPAPLATSKYNFLVEFWI